ncbi:hypothetical protein CVT24_006131 [Panaeolus cyanescens]|uniref:Major facilitator superfamily (MFS) profile domain-containing protein n=1 Tax=Panaeolus cyanescens TaxID=181874 RepID=A0A409YDT0_9AGAR|nr:hypothetical protein CVT24_006131 [Panaeolus cyanescens]
MSAHSHSTSTSYDAKIEAVNAVLRDIGMGRYQWALFFLIGFGYYADNLWPIITGLILPPVVNEFRGSRGPFINMGQGIGLLIGAIFWGAGSDIWGRRISFNITFLITGVFAVSAGASPNFAVLVTMVAFWSLGVGGNLPVDTSIFLEFTPSTHQHLLTVLSVWWAFGQLVGSLVAWPLIGNPKFSCPSPSQSNVASYSCPESQNRGWRYFLYAMGGLTLVMWLLRFFAFHLYETPKYLVGKGREKEAGEVLERVRRFNGREKGEDIITLNDLLKLKPEGSDDRVSGEEKDDSQLGDRDVDGGVTGGGKGAVGNVKQRLVGWYSTGIPNELSLNHVRPLFETREKTVTTCLLMGVWGQSESFLLTPRKFLHLSVSDCIGVKRSINTKTISLETRGATFGDGSVYTTYRNQVILSAIGVPAAILAGYLVSLPYLGRRGTLALSTLLTGVFILVSTTSRSSNALLGWNCAYTFTSNVMYGVLYGMTPELFESKDRGTANALTAACNRVFGIMAPIIALYADLTTSVPIFIAGAIFVGAGMIALLIPVESRDVEAR